MTERKKIAFFMDNAAIHTASLVKKMYNEWECSVILNSPNTPDLNPAELVIGLLK